MQESNTNNTAVAFTMLHGRYKIIDSKSCHQQHIKISIEKTNSNPLVKQDDKIMRCRQFYILLYFFYI